MCGYGWRCVSKYGYVQLCVAIGMGDYVWLCVAVCSYV